MMKTLCSGAAALAMMTGVALAQGVSSDTTTSTQSTTTTTVIPAAPATSTYNSSKWQKSTDSNGVQTDKSQSYSSGANGSKATSTIRTTEPDGSQTSTQRDERTISPSGDTTTNKSTTTTTITH